MMDLEMMKKQWKTEETAAFQGWDFSRLKGRWESEELSWDYRMEVLTRLRPIDRLLDMGTGGGEFLLTLGHPGRLTAVTESYPPNVRLCKKRLTPLGIQVEQVFDCAPLPFADASFDVVINRHESFTFDEVARILRPGGYFITQQVGGENNRALSKRLIAGFVPPFPQHNLEQSIQNAKQAGLNVINGAEEFPPLRFFDIGALVYFAKIIEWEFPGFSVDACLEELCSLQAEMERTGSIVSREHRFLLIAQKQIQ